MRKTNPAPALTAADFSIDGARILISVAKALHSTGWRYCPRCCGGDFPRHPKSLESFSRHDRPREISGMCRECKRNMSRTIRGKEIV